MDLLVKINYAHIMRSYNSILGANIAQNGSSVAQLCNKFHVGKIWALPIASKACVSADEFPLRGPSRKRGNEH